MQKILHRMLSLISAIVMTVTMFSSVLASNVAAPDTAIYKYLSIAGSTGLSFETSGTMEKITTSTDGWIMQAGGNVASTHYARAKYKLPETVGTVFTYFHAKVVVVLPADFYTQQKAGFRILNTDNYPTTLNGASVGASNENELRVSIYMNSDHKIRLLVDHETGTKLTLYTAPNILPTGEHTFELAGDVANNAPWYLKIDGVIVASGVQRLSTDDMADSERVITRIVAGIDGAADQDTNSMNILVKSLAIANYDVSNVTATSMSPTATTSVTPTVMAPTAVWTTTPALLIPTNTPAISTTATNMPTGQNSLNAYIKTGKNDAEENSQGKINLSSDDLELVYDGSNQVIGLRFVGVNIPKGATIVSASIQFKVDEVHTKAVSLNIQGELNPNAPVFATTTRNISSRLKTKSLITWSPLAWSKSRAAGPDQLTPNVAPILQEIIDQSGWLPGNSLVIIITGTGKRVATSFEGLGAPYLHIEYNNGESLSANDLVLSVMPTATFPLSTPSLPVTATQTANPAETTIPTETLQPVPSPTIIISPTNSEVILPTETPQPTPTQ